MCKLAASSIPGRNLDLTLDGGDGVQRQIADILDVYKKDFPAPAAPAQSAAVVRHAAQASAPVELEVTFEEVIASDDDFRRRLSIHNREAEEHEATEIRNFLNSRIQWLTDELDATGLAAKARH